MRWPCVAFLMGPYARDSQNFKQTGAIRGRVGGSRGGGTNGEGTNAGASEASRARVRPASALDEVAQALERAVPLPRDEVQIVLQGDDRPGIELEAALAAGARAAHEARPLQHAQMLGDRLTSELRVLGEP